MCSTVRFCTLCLLSAALRPTLIPALMICAAHKASCFCHRHVGTISGPLHSKVAHAYMHNTQRTAPVPFTTAALVLPGPAAVRASSSGCRSLWAALRATCLSPCDPTLRLHWPWLRCGWSSRERCAHAKKRMMNRCMGHVSSSSWLVRNFEHASNSVYASTSAYLTFSFNPANH